jgi:dolichol-phosphate mannosyltransferase
VENSFNVKNIAPFISMIVPTYNESQNIDDLINRVHTALVDIEHEIIVVDDDSPDMT